MSEKVVPWLVFEVGPDFYCALNLEYVVEIVPSVTLSPLPNAGRVLDGLANIRGTVIPTINMRRVFQLEDRPISHSDHLIIVKTSQGHNIGLRVDRTVELANLQLSGNECMAGRVCSVPYITGIAKHNDRLILLHDPNLLVETLTARLSLQSGDIAPARLQEAAV